MNWSYLNVAWQQQKNGWLNFQQKIPNSQSNGGFLGERTAEESVPPKNPPSLKWIIIFWCHKPRLEWWDKLNFTSSDRRRRKTLKIASLLNWKMKKKKMFVEEKKSFSFEIVFRVYHDFVSISSPLQPRLCLCRYGAHRGHNSAGLEGATEIEES